MFAKASIKRPVTTLMILLMVWLAGIVSYRALNLDLMPSVDVPVVFVNTTYYGAGPKEVEKLITEPLEGALSSVSNVDKVSSVSSANSSMIIVQFIDGTDIDLAAIDLREKIDLIKGSLPEDASTPMVLKIDVNAQTIMVGLTSDRMSLDELNNFAEDNIVNQFERIAGVSSADVYGGDVKEIQVIVDPEKLKGYGISMTQISQTLAAENINMPIGTVGQGGYNLQVRTVGEFESIQDIENIPISTPTGAKIALSDIAQVVEGNVDRTSYSVINSKEGLILSISKESTANIVDVSEKIIKTIDDLNQKFGNINLILLTSTADYIELSISNVANTAFLSAAIAVLVLLLFLRNWKTALVVGISIPTSILATFGLMYIKNMTMNIISMGGVVIGIGMLVDNSIVVLENIYRHYELTKNPKEAAAVGTNQVGMAITASTLTTVAVFLPLIFVRGSFGQLLSNLAYTICFSLFASLVIALTVVPMACSKLLAIPDIKMHKENKLSNLSDKIGIGIDKIYLFYKNVLNKALDKKKKTVLTVIIVFVVTLAIIPIIGVDLMPKIDEGSAQISISMPKGTELDQTTEVVDLVLDKISTYDCIEKSYGMVGGSVMSSGTDSATVYVELVEQKNRDISTSEFCDDLKLFTDRIPGAEITVSASSMAMGSFGGKSLSFDIKGNDTEILTDISNDIVKHIEGIEGAKDVTSSAGEVIPEVEIKIDRQKATEYGINTSAFAGIIKNAISGGVATQYKIDGNEYDIKVQYADERTKYIDDLKGLTVDLPTGASVPIEDFADITIKDSSVSITRVNQQPYLTIEADNSILDSQRFKNEALKVLNEYPFPDGYYYEFSGMTEAMVDTFSDLILALLVAILLVFMIMASQFESLVHPFVVMFSMPLAITGGILGLFVTGNTITITAFMGFIMLSGMVVNNAIVLIDAANQLKESDGLSAEDAIRIAGPTRLRPILMTTLTTILGLVPMAILGGEGTEMQRPLGIAVIFGLALSTIITLIFVPIVYISIDNFRMKKRAKREEKKKKLIEESK